MLSYEVKIPETFTDYTLLRGKEDGELITSKKKKILIKTKDLRKVMIRNDNVLQQRSPFWT